MKHLLTLTRSYYATVLVATIALSAFGCADSASVSQDVAVPLSRLTVTPGTLQPAFSSNTTSYTVDVSKTVTSVTVTASPKESTTTMTINGVFTNPGQGRPVPLSSSGTTTTVTIVLMNQNGIESTYEVIVRKVDNNLSALSVTPGSLVPPFAASTLTYQVDVGSNIDSVTVVATKVDPHAIMSGSVTAGAGVATGQATIPLNGPGLPTAVSITVAVLNGDTKTYTITVNRLSGDNTLRELSVVPGPLNPTFAAGTTIYSVDVASNIDKVTISATKSDPNAAMSGHVTAGPGTATGTETLSLGGQGSSTDFFITVAAPDSSVPTKSYKITVHRAVASSNANLSGLSAVPGFLDQAFNANILAYTVVNIPTGDTIVFVTATKSDPNAVMLIGSQTVPAGTASSGQVPTGINTTMLITVTAQDGVTIKTYTITVP